jgi:ribose transport system permease protein
MTAATPTNPTLPPAPGPQAPATAEPAPRRSVRDAITLLNKLGPVFAFACVFALFAILQPATFLRPANLQIILLETAVVGTAALGATVIIISGGIDLSVGSNIALCTVVIAKMLAANYAPWLAAVAGVAAGTAVGLLIGLLVTGLKISPFIVTLGLWGGVRGLAKYLADESEVYPPHATSLNSLLQMLQPSQRWMIVPPGVWMMLVLAVFVAAVLRYTRFGRHVFAIGSNEQTARLCGVRVERTKVLMYCFAAAFAGVAGVLMFSKLTMGDPTTASGYELDIIAAVVIGGASLSGGQGTIFGTLIGALLMRVVANGCNKVGMSNSVQDMVTGGIIIAAAALDRIRHRRAG